jgi:hypothetical protein
MTAYEVLVNGTNFLILFNGKSKKMGFYTKVYVQADNVQNAEFKAMDMIREHENLKKIVLNKKEDPPMMYLEEMVEINNFRAIQSKTQGLAWYEEVKK